MNDVIESTPNKLAGEIIDYHIRFSMYDECREFILFRIYYFHYIVKEIDKLYLGFLTKLSMAFGKIKESIIDATLKLKENPENPCLLYYQTKGLLELKMNDKALKNAKCICELYSESTSAWALLAYCYYLNGDYKRVHFHVIVGFVCVRYCSSI